VSEYSMFEQLNSAS